MENADFAGFLFAAFRRPIVFAHFALFVFPPQLIAYSQANPSNHTHSRNKS
jgi:hypothetical protein